MGKGWAHIEELRASRGRCPNCGQTVGGPSLEHRDGPAFTCKRLDPRRYNPNRPIVSRLVYEPLAIVVVFGLAGLAIIGIWYSLTRL